MKIYDKKKFWSAIIFFGGFALIEAVISLIVLLINFGAGLVMLAITFIISKILFKSVSYELRQINYDTNQKKQALRQ